MLTVAAPTKASLRSRYLAICHLVYILPAKANMTPVAVIHSARLINGPLSVDKLVPILIVTFFVKMNVEATYRLLLLGIILKLLKKVECLGENMVQ
jgi:hypothetical protein